MYICTNQVREPLLRMHVVSNALELKGYNFTLYINYVCIAQCINNNLSIVYKQPIELRLMRD